MNLQVVGTTKLKKDAVCPYCKEVSKRAGSNVEIILDCDIGKQYAYFCCYLCKEQVMLA